MFREWTGVRPGMRVLDVGCGSVGLRAFAPELDVTGIDLLPQPTYEGPFEIADATVGLPFEDDEFDLVYASSVVEHVAPERRPMFAQELRRVARGWYRSAAATGDWASPRRGRRSISSAGPSSSVCSARLAPSD
jgi:SAM-dependent methyltransferase